MGLRHNRALVLSVLLGVILGSVFPIHVFVAAYGGAPPPPPPPPPPSEEGPGHIRWYQDAFSAWGKRSTYNSNEKTDIDPEIPLSGSSWKGFRQLALALGNTQNLVRYTWGMAKVGPYKPSQNFDSYILVGLTIDGLLETQADTEWDNPLALLSLKIVVYRDGNKIYDKEFELEKKMGEGQKIIEKKYLVFQTPDRIPIRSASSYEIYVYSFVWAATTYLDVALADFWASFGSSEDFVIPHYIALKSNSTSAQNEQLFGFDDEEKFIVIGKTIIEDNYPYPHLEFIFPIEDAYVSEGFPTNNFENVETLYLQSYTSKNKRIFLKFDLSTLPKNIEVVEARLCLYAWRARYSRLKAGVYAVRDDSWGESTVTWSNQPKIEEMLDATLLQENVVGWYSWDITNFLQEQLQSDMIVGIGLISALENDRGQFAFISRGWQNREMWPYLEVVWRRIDI